MRRSLRHRTPPVLFRTTESEISPADETPVKITRQKHDDHLSPQTPSLIRRRLRSWASVAPPAMDCDDGVSYESLLEQRVQELLELHQVSQKRSEIESSVELSYVDVNAIMEEDEAQDPETCQLFMRICPDGELSCFLMEGWTEIPLASQPVPSFDTPKKSPPPLQNPLSINKKRKSRAHVLPAGSLSLIPFGQDERLLWSKRIFHFIGKMRKVLGDRRISLPWGGSIVDSVIGVYVTQNVSDTFSSKAFMNITSKFPSPAPKSECSDIVDWKRVVRSPVSELSHCIECRGMHNVLAQRIMTFLKQVEDGTVWKWWCERQVTPKKTTVRPPPDSPFAELFDALDQLQCELNPPPNPGLLGYVPGELSLEWMRRLDCESVTELLTSKLEGFGEKSAACVTLLCFHWKSFPVDVNVARICARLGWIPLKSTASIEDLDLYAPEVEVHKYLKARLSHFDFDTLYELHYLMITMGKVFCTKTTPRCSACPLRNRCEYACNGGKRFERLVSIKKRRKNKDIDNELDATPQPMTPAKSDRNLRSRGHLSIEMPITPGPRQDTHQALQEKKPLFELHSASVPVVEDIEDMAGVCRPQRPHDSVGSVARPLHSMDLKEVLDDTKMALPVESYEMEITRILTVFETQQASVKNEEDAGRMNGSEPIQTVCFTKDMAMQILNIDSTETEQQTRSQYKLLSKLVHPDKCSHKDASMAFSLLSQAYQTICHTPDSASDLSSVELAEDEQTESFVVSRLPIAIRTPLTFTHSRNILHAFHFRDPSSILPFVPASGPNLSQFELFLLPDPRGHFWNQQERNDMCHCDVFPLITARDAMDSRFPLNGTFFQTNELFVIDGPPLVVPNYYLSSSDDSTQVSIVRVYFGTSVSRITLGMGTAEVTHLFNHSYICVRNFSFETKQATKLHAFLSP